MTPDTPLLSHPEAPDPTPDRAPAARMALVVLLGTLLAAVGAAGIGRLLTPAAAGAAWVPTARLVGLVALVVGGGGLLVYRRRLRPLPERGPDPTISALATAGTLMILLALVAYLMPSVSLPGGSPGGGPGGGGARMSSDAVGPPPPPIPPLPGRETRGAAFDDDPTPPPTPPERRAPRADGEPAPGADLGLLADLGNLFLVLLVLAVVLAGVFGRKRRRRGDEEEADPPLDPARARAGLAASLTEVDRVSGEPAERIVSAYHRLLDALAAAGAPRLSHEAPHEHLRRVLGPLGVPAGAMHRLATLYVAAEFGPRPVTDRERTAAAEALGASLQALDAAHGVPA